MSALDPDIAGRNWRSLAACRGLDTELFFPVLDGVDTEPTLSEQIRTAKAVCGRCPVRQRCLDEALRLMPYGIAGGLTPTERQRLRPGSRPEPEHWVRKRTGGATRAAPVQTRPPSQQVEGSAAATAAPLRISQNTPLQGTRVMEGTRF